MIGTAAAISWAVFLTGICLVGNLCSLLGSHNIALFYQTCTELSLYCHIRYFKGQETENGEDDTPKTAPGNEIRNTERGAMIEIRIETGNPGIKKTDIGNGKTWPLLSSCPTPSVSTRILDYYIFSLLLRL